MIILARWLLNSLVLLLITYLITGIQIESFWTAVLAALVLGLINALVRPLFVILTLPVTIVTLGLFILVINALLFWLVSAIVPGFEVAGFVNAFLGALIFSIMSWITNQFIKN